MGLGDLKRLLQQESKIYEEKKTTLRGPQAPPRIGHQHQPSFIENLPPPSSFLRPWGDLFEVFNLGMPDRVNPWTEDLVSASSKAWFLNVNPVFFGIVGCFLGCFLLRSSIRSGWQCEGCAKSCFHCFVLCFFSGCNSGCDSLFSWMLRPPPQGENKKNRG